MVSIYDYIKSEITTEAVQNAIDRAAGAKQVLCFPAGVYQVSGLYLPSDSHIYLEKDAVIAALTEEAQWENCQRMPLLFSENTDNIRICGGGELCCNGWAFVDHNGARKKTVNRPEGVVLIRNSRNIAIEGVRLTETVGWTLHLDNCEEVLVDGVIIRNPPYHRRKNSDGIDINGCRNVIVRNCDVETGDDGICLKNIDYSDHYSHPDRTRKDMYNIRVSDCKVASTCNATKIGTETVGNIYDVQFERIQVCKHSEILLDGAGEPPVNIIHPLAAISVQSNDGAQVHDISFKDYDVKTVDTPIFMLVQKRRKYVTEPPMGEVARVKIENLHVEKAYRNSQILASEGMSIKDVSLSQVHVTTYENGSKVYRPMLPTGIEYPDVYNFGTFPAYGLYARNTENLCVGEDVVFVDAGESGRPAVDAGQMRRVGS